MDEKDQKILALSAEVASLKKILSLVPGNVYWKDRSGKYLGCNEGNAKMINLNSPQDIVGKTIYELMEPQYAEPIVQIDNEVMEVALERVIEEYAPDIDGNPAVYLTRKVPLRNDDGNVVGLVGISIDITGKKKNDEELARLQQKEKNEEIFSLRKIISLMPGNVYWKDKQGRYLGCNENIAKLAKLPSAYAIIGKTLHNLIEKQYADAITKIDEELVVNNREITIEENGFGIPGSPAIYLTRKTPLRDSEGKVIGLLGISIDITERKKMEQELRSAKEVAEAALTAKEIAEAESREKSLILKNVLEDLKEKERYYLSGEHKGLHLTQREAQCLVCLAHGYSVKQIGKSLELSPRTVEVYIERMKIKLKCNTKAELIAKAIECRFLEGIRPVVPVP